MQRFAAVAVLLLSALGIVLLGFQGRLPQERRLPPYEPPTDILPPGKEATDHFMAFVQNKLTGQHSQLEKAFYDCFIAGVPAAHYHGLFKTADEVRRLDPKSARGADTLYQWRGPGEGWDRTSFDVLVGGTPPVILHCEVRKWSS
jgi:hypothetical protein